MPDKLSIKLTLDCSIKITKWKVEEKTIVYDGRILFIYEEVPSGKSAKLKSKNVGVISKIFAKEGDVVNPGDELLEIDAGCTHPTVINDLCAECGADLQKEGQTESKATIPMVHSIPQLKVSHEQAQQIGKADTDRLIRDRKLVLLVDLDQTLIHTTHDNIPNNIKDVHHFQLFGSPNQWYHTRLRPGALKFLRNLAPIFELHICTFGVRAYAHTVARILDENGSLFSSRILSRDECFDSNSKFANLQALFPCGDELVCIIDDREDVWNYSPNLIQVKPYQFFRSTGDIHDPNLPPAVHSSNNYLAPGIRLKEKNTEDKEEPEDNKKKRAGTKENLIDVDDTDDYLLYLETILRRVHSKFYEAYDKKIEEGVDVKKVIAEERASVLKGCEIILSGLVPLRVPLEDSVAAQMATKLGAKVVQDLGPNSTHLIAAVKGTAKVHQAKKMKNIHVVNPHWLVSCSQRWEKVDERLFELGTGGPLPFCKSLQSKDISPQFIALSQEDMDAMTQEVGEDSDNGIPKDFTSKSKMLLIEFHKKLLQKNVGPLTEHIESAANLPGKDTNGHDINLNQPNKKTMMIKTSKSIREALNTLLAVEKEKLQLSQKEEELKKNEDYHFVMSLLPELQKIPPEKKLEAKIKIQQLILEEQQVPN